MRQFGRGSIDASVDAVRPDKVGVAKFANRFGTFFFPARPQIAPRKTAKHSRTARVVALTLNGIEDFFDRIHKRFRLKAEDRRQIAFKPCQI